MSEVFSAENCTVEIYLDDGSGAPSGATLFDVDFRRATSQNRTSQPEHIPHAGYEYDEIAAGKEEYRLEISKVIQGIDDDLFLSSALYYIRVIEHDDSYSNWDRYNCKKCRFAGWQKVTGDTGVVMAQARFICEQIVPENVP